MKPYLILSASGNLGSSLVAELRDSGKSYVGSVRNEPIPSDACIHFDLSNFEQVRNFPVSDYSTIFYVAQSKYYKSYPSGIDDMWKINVHAPFEIASRASELNIPFVYASSGSVYKSSTLDLHEDDDLLEEENLNMYTTTKIAADVSLSKLNSVKIIRPFYIFGPNSSLNSLIPTLFKKIYNRESVKLIGDQGIIINPIYCLDAARAFIHVGRSNLDKVNLAGLEKSSIREICEMIGKIVGKAPIFETTSGVQQFSTADVTTLRNSGFNFNFSLNEGLKHYWNHQRNF